MSKEKYHIFYNEHHNKLPIFVHPWYLDAVCNDGGWNACIVEEKSKIIAVLPYFIKKKYGFHYITMPHFVKMMGPFFANALTLSEQHDVMEKLILQLPKVDAFTQNFYYNITNWLPFYWNDYQQTTRYSYLLDVSDLDEVYHNIHRKRRRYIEKAAEQGLQVVINNDAELFYKVNKMSFDRQKIKIPYTFEAFQRHDEALAAHEARQIFMAQDVGGRVHSVVYLIWDAQSSYFHIAGDDPDLRNSGAGILLIWEVIKYTKEKLNLNTFDFEGSMIPNVEYIRRQFGAVQTPYFTITKYDSGILALARRIRAYF
ncbi:MAG: GNAT family N-acetyltransferase [Saprospiraceae bacterium]